nr:1-phosphatidylinositol-3-phosphate 5-kinase FAB1B-like [Tanacetum cinerariifolium]
MDHLKMVVAKIDAHQPDVLLVEKSVSRYAQEYLLGKDISLVINIKRPLLERIVRCTGVTSKGFKPGGKKNQPMIDILEINRLRRQLLFQSYVERSGGGSSPKEDNEIDVSDPLRENVGGGVHSALFKEQISLMASLLDTLDAAWTGNKMDTPSVVCDSDKGHHGEDQLLTTSSLPSPTFSTKGSENITEDSTSWFNTPFLNFYRAKNKNSIATSQNLDTLNSYKPVYISTYCESELEGRARLLLAVGANDNVIPVYADDPTSIISYALLTPDYMPQMSGD